MTIMLNAAPPSLEIWAPGALRNSAQVPRRRLTLPPPPRHTPPPATPPLSPPMPTDGCDSLCCVKNGAWVCTPNASWASTYFVASSAVVKQVVASSCASVISTVALNPINVMKVYLQSNHQPIGEQSGLLSGLRRIIRTRGAMGFWSGTSSGLAMSVPNTVLYMTTFEAIKSKLHATATSPREKLAYTGVSGFLARVVAVSVVSPLELIRTLQSGGTAQSISSIGRQIVARDGVAGLYRGWFPTILRDCPYSAIYWLCFDAVRPFYASIYRRPAAVGRMESSEQAPSPYATFLSGASSGMVAAFVTHPFDVTKTKRQLAVLPQAGAAMAAPLEVTLGRVLREEGVRGLYRGLSMRLITVIPASAIMITVYETIKNL